MSGAEAEDPPPARPLGRALAGLRAHEALRETEHEPPGAAPADARPAPAQVGEYRIVAELGRGGAGVVYAARSQRLDRLVALKLLRAERTEQPEMRERFEIEARSAARLRHPHIVGIHEVGEDQAGHPFLVMELVSGRTLAARLREEGALPPRDAARIAEKLARALAYAHGRGVLHRDVKPGNVLLGPEGEPLLTDFGLAKVLEDGASTPTVTGQVMGTPAYMSPEQARGETSDARSDVWSLGATLFEMLTARPPFAGPSVAGVLASITGPTPVASPRGLRPELDRDLATVCLRCLEKDLADRYRTAAEVAEDLARWLRDEPVRARPPGALERARKWLRRNPVAARTLLATSAIALSLGLAGALAFLRRLETERDLAREAARREAAAADRARQAADQARASAQEARLALDLLVREVQDGLGDLPGEELRQARARLLAQAGVRLQRLQELGVESPDGASPAELKRRLGSLALAAGRTEEALRLLDEAVLLARQRVAADRGVAEAGERAGLVREQLRWELLTNLVLRGDALDHASRDTQARADLEEAYRLLSDLRAGTWDPARVVQGVQLLGRVSRTRRSAGDVTGSLAAACEALQLVWTPVGLMEPERSRALSAATSELGQSLVAADDAPRALQAFEVGLAIDRRLLRVRESYQDRRGLVVGLLDVGDAARALGRAPRAREVYDEALEQARRLAAIDPDSLEARRAVFMCAERGATLRLELHDLEGALSAAEEGLATARLLLERDPGARVLLDDASSVLDLIGQARERRGELALAVQSYEEALRLDRVRLARDPAAPESRQRVAQALERLIGPRRLLGDRAGAEAALAEGLQLARDLPDTFWELRSSLTLHQAALLLEQRDLDGAQVALEAGLTIRRAALAASPDQLVTHQGLGWALTLRGDLLLARRDVAGALAATEEGVAVYRRARELAPGDLIVRSGLASALVRQGALLRDQQQLDRAQATYEEALALRRAMAEEDPGALQTQRDVLVLLGRLAELRLQRGDGQGALAGLDEVLAGWRQQVARDPAPAARRDLAVALLKAGEGRQAAGDLDGAGAAFAEGTEVLAGLAEADPGDVAAQRDLFAAAQRLLAVRLPQRRLDEALAAAERLLQAARAGSQAQGDPPAARRDVSIALMKRADVWQARGDHEGVLRDLRAAVEIHRGLAAESPRWAAELERMERMLATVERGG